jgi:hypothetical protein
MTDARGIKILRINHQVRTIHGWVAAWRYPGVGEVTNKLVPTHFGFDLHYEALLFDPPSAALTKSSKAVWVSVLIERSKPNAPCLTFLAALNSNPMIGVNSSIPHIDTRTLESSPGKSKCSEGFSLSLAACHHFPPSCHCQYQGPKPNLTRRRSKVPQ